MELIAAIVGFCVIFVLLMLWHSLDGIREDLESIRSILNRRLSSEDDTDAAPIGYSGSWPEDHYQLPPSEIAWIQKEFISKDGTQITGAPDRCETIRPPTDANSSTIPAGGASEPKAPWRIYAFSRQAEKAREYAKIHAKKAEVALLPDRNQPGYLITLYKDWPKKTPDVKL